MKIFLCFMIYAMTGLGIASAEEKPLIRVGSKNFTEGYVLAEILAQAIEKSGNANVERRFGMGGTGIVYQSLESNEIDIYPEYTGTISLAILHEPKALNTRELQKKLEVKNLAISDSVGFNNSYGLAISKSLSKELSITKISDLKHHPSLRFAFSHEFMERKDGYPAMEKHYNLNSIPPIRMDHSLVYSALNEKKVDVIEVYTTDSKIEKYNLVVLKDDREFFPKYEGVFIYRKDLIKTFPEIRQIFSKLKNSITDDEMIRLNSLVENNGRTFTESAENFYKETPSVEGESDTKLLTRLTKRHLLLVLIPVLISLAIGIPMGIMAAKIRIVGQVFLLFSGLVQTIPSLALLCFLIPVFGIGFVPSMVALVLYGLLPIVRTTYSGILSIEPHYQEVARVIGLNRWQKLARIELPLASMHIMGGIQTAAVMNVGMATLAAFIGAGGYGSLIVTGLALNDNNIILKGALPAAVMAVLIHFVFEIIEKLLTPRGLKY